VSHNDISHFTGTTDSNPCNYMDYGGGLRDCACGCLAVRLAPVCGLSLQPIGCASALACDVQRYCSCSCRSWRYIHVSVISLPMPFTFYRKSGNKRLKRWVFETTARKLAGTVQTWRDVVVRSRQGQQ